MAWIRFEIALMMAAFRYPFERKVASSPISRHDSLIALKY